MSYSPDALARKVLGDLRGEIHEKLGGFAEERPFETAVTLPVAEAGPFDYVVVGYRNSAEKLRQRLFHLRAGMVGRTATFELRPSEEDESDRALALAPRQLRGADPARAKFNGNMEAVGLRLDTELGTGMAYGNLNAESRQTNGDVHTLQAHFNLSNFVHEASPNSSTFRAVAAYDFAHTMLGHVVDLSHLSATPDIAPASQDVVGAA